MKAAGEMDDGFKLRVHMTFSERAHPRFIEALRGLPPRARSRLIRTLVERALATGPENDLPLQGFRSEAPGDPSIRGSRWTQQRIESPLASLSSTGSLSDAEEMGV